MTQALAKRIEGAWAGRISGCMLGKPVEMMSMRAGFDHLDAYLRRVDALPLRDYVPFEANEPQLTFPGCCRGRLERSEPDDDINYSVLALMMLEAFGEGMTTADVARSWLRHLPLGATYTAERAAYRILLERGHEWFPEGHDPGFDLGECADNPYNDWIGAQIRADVYGWVCPGQPSRAAQLASADAALSHRGDGVHGAVFVAVVGALIPEAPSVAAACEGALDFIPSGSEAARAVRLGLELAGRADGDAEIRARYPALSPVHTVNNLAIVVWALVSHPDDFGAAIGDAVAAGWDTDCNGATVGGLWGLQGKAIPESWTMPWAGRVGVGLAGQSELRLDELVNRTVALARSLSAAAT